MEGNSFLGVFARASDRLTVLPRNAPEKLKRACAEVLKTPVITASISNSSLIGVFCAMNSNGAVLPSTAYESEIKWLKENALNAAVVDDKRSALGNNLLVNDNACLANPSLSKTSLKAVEDCLGVEVVTGTVGGSRIVGSAAVVTNRGLLTRTNVSEEEFSFLEELFKVKGALGTANMGVSFVGLCVIANSHGFVVGEMTTGFEVQRMDEAFGFIGD